MQNNIEIIKNNSYKIYIKISQHKFYKIIIFYLLLINNY